jgi:hypothetical protein
MKHPLKLGLYYPGGAFINGNGCGDEEQVGFFRVVLDVNLEIINVPDPQKEEHGP